MELPAAPKQAKPDQQEAKVGRSLWAYLLPVLVAAALGLGLLAFFALQYVQTSRSEMNQTGTRVAAEALAARIGEYLRGRADLMEVVSRSGAVRQALMSPEPATLQRTSRAMEKLLPGALRIRLFPVQGDGEIKPDPQGKAPMGFAGVDMIRRALQGQQTPAEIHQITSGHPYLAMAQPIEEGEQVVGAAFVAWPIVTLQRLAAQTPDVPGRLWLVQGGVDGYVVSGTDGEPPPKASPAIPVPGSIWKVYYDAAVPGWHGGLWLLLSIAAAGMVLVVGVLLMQLRALRRDLRADMGALAALGESIADGQGAGEHIPLTAVARDAMRALCQLARERRRNGAKGPDQPLKVESVTADSRLQDEAAAGIQVRETEERPPVKAPPQIFRAYDIRGLADTEVTEEVALGLGWAFGELTRDNGVDEVFVAHDPRLSSPLLYDALCAGLAEMGLRVVELGMAPVALLYYAMHRQPETAAIMVTGSHNPPEYNGFKLYLRAAPVHGDQLQALCERMRQGGFEPRAGSREPRDLLRDYLDAVAQDVSLGRAATVVVDGGNGAAGEVACALFEMLGCEVVPLFCEPDGRFPNHHPDPGDPKNLEALKAEVVSREATLGIAFDGDGDRIGVVDDQGQPARPEHLLMLLAADILRRHPGSDVVFDVKSSRHLAGFILSQGGRPIMWRAGHTRMKEKMLETGALVGGEYSGHIYIKERWFGSDDAIYVAARLLEVVTDDARPFHEQLEELPVSPATPELQLMMEEGQPQQAMQAIMAVANFPDARVVDLDGLRIEFGDSWGLVRPSNTTPSLVFRFEADDEMALEEIEARFRELLQKALPDVTPPF